MDKKKNNAPSTYKVWAKVNEQETVTYNTSYVEKTVKFMIGKWPSWRFMRVYLKSTNECIENFTPENICWENLKRHRYQRK